MLHLYAIQCEELSVSAIYDYCSEDLRSRPDSKGRNFLHCFAIGYKRFGIIKDRINELLAKEGVIELLRKRDSNGKTPVDLAKELNAHELIQVYQDALEEYESAGAGSPAA